MNSYLEFFKVSIMFDYRLKIFEGFEKKNWVKQYRFAVIDPKNYMGYPANFVCLLPKEIFESGKPLSPFGKLFGEKSPEYAIKLLKEALKQEKDEEVKNEIMKRIKLLEAKKPKLICSSCHEAFEEYCKTKYRHKLCKSCLETKIFQNQI